MISVRRAAATAATAAIVAALFVCPRLSPRLSAQTVVLPELVATAARGSTAPMQAAFSQRTFSEEELTALPAATLDGALRAVPGFSLFRRSDSLTANPTAQGVSLRGLGPSGASRSLVLLDGVPLNDPFGGWIAWSKVPRAFLGGADISPGGGATAWGNAALAGVVQLRTRAPAGQDHVSGAAVATVGDFETRSLEAGVDTSTPAGGGGTLQLFGRVFSTEGFAVVAPERRGSIDTPAGGDHRWLTGRWRHALGESAEIEVTARAFAEERANGTPHQRNASRETFGSVAVNAQPSAAFSWTARAYAQAQSFSSTFSSVNATRSAETPASDQYAVPSDARGALWTGAWAHRDGATTAAGVDARQVRGETRELFSLVAGNYTRRRMAGGAQMIGGAFAQHERPLADGVRATLGARADYWRESDGHRRESDVATGASVRDDAFAGDDGFEFSPSAGLAWQATTATRFRIAAQQAFRRPTLNELYRPFRVGGVITEANAALRTERVTSGEVGADVALGALKLSAAIFRNELRDAVGNVTLARGPATVPGFGFVPAGGAARQRLNLDRVRVQGVELSATWTLSPAFALNADYLFDDARVRRAAVAPSLAGLRLAQVPKHSASVGGRWRMTKTWTLAPRVRWLGAQFEDDENVLPLKEALVGDVSLTGALRRGLEMFATVENLGDARLETGRSADGVVAVGQPRFVTGGVRINW